MKKSVIITAYNEEKYIADCLKSLQNQTVKPDEILVIDNNSTDTTHTIAETFEGVTVLTETKQGITHARNRGLNTAQGDIIIRTDADTTVPPDWVEHVIRLFNEHNVDAVTGDIVYPEKVLHTRFISASYRFMCRIIYGFDVLLGPNMAIKKSTWEKIRDTVCLNDKEVHEDVDISIHLDKSKGTIYYDKTLLVVTSSRRMIHNPYSLFVEYLIRMLKTYKKHYMS